MPNLKLKNIKLSNKRSSPLWKGPEVDGITFSILSRFLCCRERFRLMVVEGLKPVDTYNHRLSYGNMWHTCEESHAANEYWQMDLKDYATSECTKYPGSQREIDKWYNVCKVQFPIYVDYWHKNEDVVNRVPIFQEKVFEVPYTLPSGRIVKLKGKFDAVDYIKGKVDAGIYIQENKSKGMIDEQQILRNLTFDLQTMIYIVALQEFRKHMRSDISDFAQGKSQNYINCLNTMSQTVRDLLIEPLVKLQGVRYNVVRRPLSGGKGSIKQKKATKNKPAETKEEYYKRLGKYISDDPKEYFRRYKVNITQQDIDKFKHECLNPILEQLCDWWQWIEEQSWEPVTSPFGKNHPGHGEHNCSEVNSLHYRHPFGVYNVLDEGGSSDLDIHLETGSMVGLRRIDNLFPELT